MAEATLEKATCENCGADVRESTQFCYNCGKKFTEAEAATNGTEPTAISDEAKNALDDLAARFNVDEAESGNKLAIAAAERKKARVAPKKQQEVIWEANETRSGLLLFIISLFLFVVVAIVVLITVYWK